ncbi:MAG: YicC/YloC family endoribonuclease [Nitrospinota bacterium]
MLKSMTGYGMGRASGEGHTLTVEVRSVNHRFFEVALRGPRWVAPLEAEIRRKLRERFARGRFEVFVSREPGEGEEEGEGNYSFDPQRGAALVGSLRALQEALGLPGQVDLSLLAHFRDALRAADLSPSPEEVRGPLLGALGGALLSLAAMREREGEALYADVSPRIGRVERLVEELRTRAPQARAEAGARLRERLERLGQGLPIEPGRLEQELLFYAERSDVSEELARLSGHLAQFRALLAGREAAGRKLDFLLQEMNREVNTLGAKAGDQLISQQAVEVKSELEKVREQVQNAE